MVTITEHPAHAAAIFVQATTPQDSDHPNRGVAMGDLWVDTSAVSVLKVCTSISPITFDTVGSGAPVGAKYLVGEAHDDLTAEIIAGLAPGGELGGTWASPTVDAVHSGSAHHTQQHAITSAPDHSSAATPGQVLKADANGLPVDATNTDADVADAVSKKHTQSHDLESGSDHVTSSGVDGQIMKQTGAASFAFEVENYAINLILDGGGSAITTGIKADVMIETPGVIEQVTLLADQSGSIVVDIWKDTYFPPTIADTITAAAKPTLSGASKSQDSTLTGWTTTLAAGDILRFNVDSVVTVTRVTLVLKVRKT